MKRARVKKKKSPPRKKTLTIEQFLRKYPKNIQRIATSLRQIVRRTVPRLVENVYPGWKLIGYRIQAEKRSHYFCFIAPFDEFIHLGFEDGTMLSDNHKLLRGSGKQVRHVIIRSTADIKSKHLSALIAEAAMVALMRELIQSH